VGEDFLRKKTEQFVRLRGVEFARLIGRHLFSSVAPREAVETIGSLVSPITPPSGTKLWSRNEEDGSISFFAGRERCISVPTVRAQDLRDLVSAGKSVGEIVDINLALQQARVRLTPITEDAQ
jgi:hypothetical protein